MASKQGSGPNLWLEVPAPVPGYGTSAKLRPVCRGTMAAVGMVKQDGAGETIYDEGGVPAWAFVLVEVVALTKNTHATSASASATPTPGYYHR